MSNEDYEIEVRKKAHHQELVDEQVASAAAARTQRPRMHDNSRSPRSVPSDRDSITPDPQRRDPPETHSELAMLSKVRVGEASRPRWRSTTTLAPASET